MFLEINNTSKANWILIKQNNCFDGNNGESENWMPISSCDMICVGKMDLVDFVEMHIGNDKFYLTWTVGVGEIQQVSTVNDVAPTSILDLKTKILALL